LSKAAVRISRVLGFGVLGFFGLLGGSHSAFARPLRQFRVGLVFDLSGHRDAAKNVVKGIEYAASMLKSEGIELKLEKHNSQEDALGTRKAMLDVLNDPPDIVLAEVDSSKAVIAAEMAERAQRVMITPFATSPAVTLGRKYVFRTCCDLPPPKGVRLPRQSLQAFAVSFLTLRHHAHERP